VHAYVINLARSPERRAHIAAELRNAKVDYEIITAVDGRDLDMQDRATIDPSLLTISSFPAGVAGCALSNLRVYQKMIADGVDTALVLSDDVVLPPDICSLADTLVNHLVGAEVVLLEYNNTSKDTCKMSGEGAINLPSSRLLVLPIDVRQLRGSGAYVITRDASKRMLESVLPVRAEPDDWGFFYREGAVDRVRCVVPRSVTYSPEFESTVGFYGLGNGLKARLLGPLARHKVPLLHRAISYRRQLIWRKMIRTEIVDTPFIVKPSRLE
jgi:glycosyl transferase, family 25